MLIITDVAQQRAAEIVAFARQHRNWYVPGHTPQPPGTFPELCHYFEPSTTAVFSWTYDVPNQKIYRQLCLRHVQKGKLPANDIAFTIASWFGFLGGTGFGPSSDNLVVYKASPDWIFQVLKEHDTTIISQEIPYAEYSQVL